jgi:protein gp37
MAERFGKFTSSNFATMEHVEDPGSTFELYEKPDNPYPFLFAPTFHRYRLNDYRNKKGRTIFICSMADLFGDWVPDEWIREVFRACEAAPQHRYLFLTKNPKRYDALSAIGELPKKHWYGHTVTAESDIAHGPLFNPEGFNNFLSIEPLLGNATNGNWLHLYKWIIVGAETGNRKGKVVPKKVWVDAISGRCALRNVPLFMKESLRGLMGEDFIQEYPWEVEG